MRADKYVPSWLTSWIAWRNFFTEPGKEPFNVLKEELGLDRLPTKSEFIAKSGNICPFCHDDAIVESADLGLVYCICTLLNKVQRLEMNHRLVKSTAVKKSLDDIVYPKSMGGEYIRTIRQAKEAAERFIRRPDRWMFLNGYYGIGKSHILRAINTIFEPMSLYISAGDLEQLTHKFRKEDELDFFYDTLINAPVLIIDDIGMEYGGPLVKSVIGKVVDARYEKWPDCPTLMATNMRVPEFRGYIGRAADRVLDAERTDVITIKLAKGAKSFRQMVPEMRP